MDVLATYTELLQFAKSVNAVNANAYKVIKDQSHDLSLKPNASYSITDVAETEPTNVCGMALCSHEFDVSHLRKNILQDGRPSKIYRIVAFRENVGFGKRGGI